jgi:glycosyltransferase involved in cell wall biosynthesis
MLKKQNPKLRFYIVGRYPGQRLQKICKDRKGIFLTGFVKNLEEYYLKCRVFVAPLRFGSGTKVKVINAMYRGIPTVTTMTGAEGLEVKDMFHIAIADTVEKMVEDCNALLRDKTEWQVLRNNSRKLAREKYTWERVFASLDEAIHAGNPLHET